jgi:hypothetical protein
VIVWPVLSLSVVSRLFFLLARELYRESKNRIMPQTWRWQGWAFVIFGVVCAVLTFWKAVEIALKGGVK